MNRELVPPIPILLEYLDPVEKRRWISDIITSVADQYRREFFINEGILNIREYHLDEVDIVHGFVDGIESAIDFQRKHSQDIPILRSRYNDLKDQVDNNFSEEKENTILHNVHDRRSVVDLYIPENLYTCSAADVTDWALDKADEYCHYIRRSVDDDLLEFLDRRRSEGFPREANRELLAESIRASIQCGNLPHINHAEAVTGGLADIEDYDDPETFL